ncbi:DUF5662 family protein [Deinococcus peraridilitoris]|uniref:Uncharacterized protein n=1 Tax=Deinococcus peraridilitoris (strain DSM 19664 / LMG 22246 / CIP 109416 / KR-200) TaxID=937777 RepID=L0A1A1_DEIPD|nr:DUF5662 family protein [Deinococcus peraridilitoris]AFZ67596.1 hypothetical protein Deipe_2101 [Deinococcus peraridilitoris DSM 19664]
MTYDSRPDTHEHINQVRAYLMRATHELLYRSEEHDRSKLLSPEVEVFNRVTPRLRELTYGSDEYKASLVEMGEALTHHYQHNRHHPEHHENGIKDMNLIDVLEMLCDWAAACKRHADGDIYKSIRMNAERFGFSAEFERLLNNTVEALDLRA